MARRLHDIAVIGAGVIGLSVARRLLQHKFQVTVFDSGADVGPGSLGAAGILLAAGSSRRSGDVEMSAKALREFPRFIRELHEETGTSIDFRICGSIQVSIPGDAPEPLKQQAEFHRSLGVRVETRREGLYYPDDALVDPVDLIHALRHSCARLGGNFFVGKA